MAYNSHYLIDDEIFGGNQQLKDFAHYCMSNRPISDIRKYVSLHNKELLNIGSRVLNQLIPLNGYKFLKVNGKITVSKCKGKTSSLVDEGNNSQMMTEPASEVIADSEYRLKDPFDSEATFDDSINEWNTTPSLTRNDPENDRNEINTTLPKINQIEELPIKSKSIEGALPKEPSLTISKTLDAVENEQTVPTPKQTEPEGKALRVDDIVNADLMKHLNNLYIKELGEQERKYNDMMAEIKQSIATKEKVETEKHQRVNSVLDAIESTYSTQSFASIIKSIQQMTETFITQRNEEVTTLKQTILTMNNEIQYLKGQIETFPQIVTAIVENSNKSTLSELNEIVDEKIEDINVEIKDLNDELKKLTLEDSEESKYPEVTKDEIIENINKIANVVYSLSPQSFK